MPWLESPVTFRCANFLHSSLGTLVRTSELQTSRIWLWICARPWSDGIPPLSADAFAGDGDAVATPWNFRSHWKRSQPFRNVWDSILEFEPHKITPNWIVHDSLWKTCRCLRLPMSASKCHTYTHTHMRAHAHTYNTYNTHTHTYIYIYTLLDIPSCARPLSHRIMSRSMRNISWLYHAGPRSLRTQCRSERLGSPKPWRLSRCHQHRLISNKNGDLSY